MKIHLLLTGMFLTVSCPAIAETVKDREGAVRQDKATMENDARWIYNDLERGFTEAREKHKPLLVVLRCVPCKACMGIDAGVLTEPELAPLLAQFVCVRVINANALDLTLFQFDYDLSFSTMFFNGDRTIYGRYGSWLHHENPQEKTTAGYKRALEAVLAIHRGYPANQAALAGKQGAPSPFKTSLEIPALTGKYQRELDWQGKVVPSCVHCHQIGDAYRTWYRSRKSPMPAELIFPMPPPETIGLTLAPDTVAQVEAVAADSAAAKAGVKPGDEIISLAGQPLVSWADLSWALHRAPESGALPAVVKRGAAERTVELLLPEGWRAKADISRRVGAWQMRGMAAGGLVLEDLTNDARRGRGLPPDKLALRVKFVGMYGTHAAAKKAGFQKDDVLVELDGRSGRLSEGELLGQLLQQHWPGEKLKAVVLRGTERVELTLPMQ